MGGPSDATLVGRLVQSDIRGVVSSAIPRVRLSPSVVPSGSVSKTSVTIAIEDDFGNLRASAHPQVGQWKSPAAAPGRRSRRSRRSVLVMLGGCCGPPNEATRTRPGSGMRCDRDCSAGSPADPALPRGGRVRLWLLLIYLILPIDLIPDFIPVLGYTDDAIIVAIAIRSIDRTAAADAFRAATRPCHLLRRLRPTGQTSTIRRVPRNVSPAVDRKFSRTS